MNLLKLRSARLRTISHASKTSIRGRRWGQSFR